MKKDLHESPPVIAPTTEKMEGIKEALKLSFFEAISKTGTFDIEKMTEENQSDFAIFG